MKIRMLQTTKGSPNGTHVLEYKKDEEYVVSGYPLPFELAESFLRAGAAEQVKEAGYNAPGPNEFKSDESGTSDVPEGDVPEATPRRGRQKRGMTDQIEVAE